MQDKERMAYGTGSLISSENDMMASVLLSSLGQSLAPEHLTRYEHLCQVAEHMDIVPHASPKEHMVRDFTQWFHGWLVQNEEYIQRRERAQAAYEALTATPIVMGPAAGDGGNGGDGGDEASNSHALVPIASAMPVCCGD